MKLLTAAFLTLAVPLWATAQTAPAAKQATAKPATAKVAPTQKVAKASGTSSRTQLKSAANQVASGIRAAEAALSPAELAIAERVYAGRLPCAEGVTVNIQADAASPGYFNVQANKLKYRMFPVATTTGAIRLEDPHVGAVWLQLGNKSMLMDQKRGKRVADECASPEQLAVAQALKTSPVQSVLDAPAPTAGPIATK